MTGHPTKLYTVAEISHAIELPFSSKILLNESLRDLKKRAGDVGLEGAIGLEVYGVVTQYDANESQVGKNLDILSKIVSKGHEVSELAITDVGLRNWAIATTGKPDSIMLNGVSREIDWEKLNKKDGAIVEKCFHRNIGEIPSDKAAKIGTQTLHDDGKLWASDTVTFSNNQLSR